ncbi:hypothetical protein ID866_11935 [Astraeus odoratus]|nr:hypothetical protein ID866_11935 [Astraeus odoratus]
MWKVSFTLSFLKGIALTWFKPDLLDAIPGTDPTWANNYSEFVIELTTNFGPHNPHLLLVLHWQREEPSVPILLYP